MFPKARYGHIDFLGRYAFTPPDAFGRTRTVVKQNWGHRLISGTEAHWHTAANDAGARVRHVREAG
ncbi:hypothetical protein FHR32_004903 [Streptosporangium album]|uniref:Uncharacterized protein n=1 Tax=Streptosporangium album TaxID=47479 RepID=A0A7W7S047_9ACTN|nr:hypothetical protein [Streptosporangium album]